MKQDSLRTYALCQSIVYECLYRGVFQLDLEQFWITRISVPDVDRHRLISSDSDPSIDKRISFAYRAAKALDRKIYRNVRFDNWRDDALSDGSVNHLVVNLLYHRRLRTPTTMSRGNTGSKVSSDELLDKLFRDGDSASSTSLYDRMVRIGFLGLKQHIHWHIPKSKDSFGKFHRYQRSREDRPFSSHLGPALQPSDAFTLSAGFGGLRPQPTFQFPWALNTSALISPGMAVNPSQAQSEQQEHCIMKSQDLSAEKIHSSISPMLSHVNSFTEHNKLSNFCSSAGVDFPQAPFNDLMLLDYRNMIKHVHFSGSSCLPDHIPVALPSTSMSVAPMAPNDLPTNQLIAPMSIPAYQVPDVVQCTHTSSCLSTFSNSYVAWVPVSVTRKESPNLYGSMHLLWEHGRRIL